LGEIVQNCVEIWESKEDAWEMTLRDVKGITAWDK
jgi:hypothetical protein